LPKTGLRMELRDTFMFRMRNANIPAVHACFWGTTVNKNTAETATAYQSCTVVQPTPLARSIPCSIAQTSTEEQAAFQTDRTPILPRAPRETLVHSSASVNENSDNAARDRSGILAKATGNHASLKMRKSIGIVPLPTFVFPTTVVRIWRIDR
jgi:hypothetical protein